MKKLILTVSLVLTSAVLLMSQGNYKMFETVYLKPRTDKINELNKGLAHHNKTYHSEKPYQAFIDYIAIGEHAGEYSWVMGPCTFTDLDSRPSGEHDKDWATNVMPYVKEASEFEYWMLDEKLSYTPEEPKPASKVFLRSWDVKDGKMKEFKELMESIVVVFKEKKYENAWHVYTSAFYTGNGREIVGLMGFDNWAFLDSDMNFAKDYDELHGEGAFEKFEKMAAELVDSMSIEIRESVDELSGVVE